VAKRGLGRGLSALIPDIETISGQQVRELPTDEILPNPFQPRKRFDKLKLAELAESIKQHGIVQPLVVRQKDNDYELVVGQRRLEAARILGLERVPVIVNALEDIEMVQVALIENLQREDLDAIEEAEAYSRLIDEFGMTQEELAKVLGRSRPTITNTIRLLNLSPNVQENVSRGTISMGHARALLSIDNLRLQEKVCKHLIDRQLSVRETEKLVRRVVAMGGLEKAKTKAEQEKDPHIVSIEERLRRVLGTQVRVFPGKKKGKIEIEYYSDEDLERILDLVL
jgi:ParB family chromosome partitioning protein